jgi:hypothetical protein
VSVLAPTCRRLALVVLALLGSAPAMALEVTLDPGAPTSLDAIRVMVADTRSTSCGALHLGQASYFPQLDRVVRIEVPLDEVCPPGSPPAAARVEASKDLGRLDPGRYLLRILDPAGGPVPDLPFTVYEPGDQRLELPALASEDAPGAVRLQWLQTAFAGPDPTAELRVEGQVIEIVVTATERAPEIVVGASVRRLVEATVPLPPLAAGAYEVRVIGTRESSPGLLVTGRLRVWKAAGCLPSPDALCLQDGRFRVTGSWRAFDGSSGAVRSLPLPGNDESGLLWFFARANVELSVKAIDGCGTNGHWWLFLASGSNVEYEIRVTDTQTGAVRTYANPLGTLPPLVADTAAFACGE